MTENKDILNTKPENLNPDQCFMFLDGGKTSDKYDKKWDGKRGICDITKVIKS